MTTELILPPRFLNWQMVDGKKTPVNQVGMACSAHDPANHISYEAALATGMPVAFDIMAQDGLFFLDLDKCLVDGKWTNEATAIFSSFSGAIGEVSQSGSGLHIIGRCDPRQLEDRRRKWDGWIECYTDQRFVAFGGRGWNPIGGTLRWETDWTQNLLKIVPQRENLGELPDGVDPAYTGPADDETLIATMLRSKGGAGAAFGMKASVADLWEARVDVLGKHYPAFDGKGPYDASSADAALMSHLAFWTGKDMPRMDRLFRQSGLMREKYETRDDYRRDTVQNAARLCKGVYDRPAPVAAAVASGASGDAVAAGVAFMTLPEMKKHFDGCVYIREIHRVLLPDGDMLKQEQFNAWFGGHVYQITADGQGRQCEKAFDAFTQNRAHEFPKAKRPCFRPDLPPGTIHNDEVNVYSDPKVRMIEGDVSPFLNFLVKLLPIERDRQIMLNFMASALQNPGIKFQWAPVLQGAEGNGKTLLASCLGYAVGAKYMHTPASSQIGGQFNSWIEGKMLGIVEEVHMRGRMDILDVLKPMITNLLIEVEQKGVDKRMIRNVCNFFFCTNFKDAIIKSKNDRRYAIFFSGQQSADDIRRDFPDGFFPAMYGWLKDDGYAIVANYLKHFPLYPALDPADQCQVAPVTSSTDEAIELSLSPVEALIIEATEDGTKGFCGGWISSAALTSLLQNSRYSLNIRQQAKILAGLGYERWGRAPRMVMQEDGRKPYLYLKNGLDGNFEDFMQAQCYR